MTIMPIGERAVIQPTERVVDGIIVPSKGHGTILAITHDTLTVGDTVVYHTYNIVPIDNVHIVEIKDIIARIQ